MQDKRVYTSEVHMCAYDLKATDEKGEGLVMKPTRVLTSIRPVAENLTGRCCGGHRHVHLVGGRARGQHRAREEAGVAAEREFEFEGSLPWAPKEAWVRRRRLLENPR